MDLGAVNFIVHNVADKSFLNLLKDEEQEARSNDQDYIYIKHCRVWCHHEPTVTAESVSTWEHFPFPSDFGHTQWVI